MFLRSTNRKKDGKDHRYFSIVENRRVSTGHTVQRTVLYLGEINDQQEAAWRKSLSVFDEETQRFQTLSLFPDDREVPAPAVDSLQVRLSGLELRRPRMFGNCWLACELWRQLGLEEFWRTQLPEGREGVPWEHVLRLLVINRLVAPGSEFRLHREWFLSSAMDALLGTDFAVAEKDRLYRCLDRVLAHKPALFVWLRQQWADLFHADFEVLLYDLTTAIASLRAVVGAQVAYASVCGDNRYAAALSTLGVPAPGGSQAFLAPDLAVAAPQKSGYRFTLGEGDGATAGPNDCNGHRDDNGVLRDGGAGGLRSTGGRSFAVNTAGTIWQAPAAAAPVEPFAAPATPVQ